MSTSEQDGPLLKPNVDSAQEKVAEKTQKASPTYDYAKDLEEELDELMADLRMYMGKR